MERHHPLAVLKVGGSLFDLPDLGQRLLALIDGSMRDSSVLVIPGGGPFAESIRGLDEIHHWPASVSHKLGLRGMSLGAGVVTAASDRFVTVNSFSAAARAWETALVPVVDVLWLPGVGTLPESWDVTSDSIAAWAAQQFPQRRLCLAKSVDLPEPVPDFDSAARRGLVDRHFPILARQLNQIDWINLRHSAPTVMTWWTAEAVSPCQPTRESD